MLLDLKWHCRAVIGCRCVSHTRMRQVVAERFRFSCLNSLIVFFFVLWQNLHLDRCSHSSLCNVKDSSLHCDEFRGFATYSLQKKTPDTQASTVYESSRLSVPASCMQLELGWGWHVGGDDLRDWWAGVNRLHIVYGWTGCSPFCEM